MPTDTLILGPFVFEDFSVPERMPFGGAQQMNVHKMPGGFRVVDCMGPDDADRHWRGILWGNSAMDDMLLLDSMRASGAELPFSWGAEFRTAVILHFHAEVQKVNCIHYEIAIVLSDDSGGGGIGFGGLDGALVADLSFAAGLIGL